MKNSLKKSITIILALLMVLTVGLLGACSSKGLSAYELAVLDGFSGSFEEWIASLSSGSGSGGSGGDIDSSYSDNLKSYYEEAVSEGYTGTFTQWLSDIYGNSGENSVSVATSKAILSLVSIVAYYTDNSTGAATASAGAGVIFDEDDTYAYIMTNYHVVYQSGTRELISNKINVYLYGANYDGMEIAATYIGGSMSNDIAVIKIAKSGRYANSDSRPATIANSLTVNPGDTAIAIGNPNGSGVSVTSGVVSVVSEYIDILGADDKTNINLRVIRIDTPVNSGNSGGGLFNDKGELIGIVNAKYIASDTENIGYAIPSNIALSIAERIKNTNGAKLTKCLLGITMQVTDSVSKFNELSQRTEIIQEITITTVNERSAADGYLYVGDVLKSFKYNGVSVNINTLYTIGDYIFSFEQYDNLEVTVVRDGNEITVSVPLVNVVDAN